MTINSVTSNNGLYEAMVQQAAALRAAQETRAPSPRVAQPQTGQSTAVQSPAGKSPEPGTFAYNLSAQAWVTDQRPPAQPNPNRAESPQFQRKVAGTYRSPWADANSLVVQTRSPGALAGAGGGEASVAASSPPKAEAPKPWSPSAPPEAGKPTFVEVHSVYVDAADEESGRSSRNPLFQFASQLYQNVLASGRRSSAGQYIGSSFSSVA